MIKNEPLMSASPPDQHEDDAGRDVQAPDRTGDAALHIGNRLSGNRIIYFSIILFWSASLHSA